MKKFLLLLLFFYLSFSQKTYPDIEKVHIVFSNHLDVGFDGLIDPDINGFAINVINRYFSVYFPRAIEIIQSLKDENKEKVENRDNYTLGYIYSTQSWLIDIYLNSCESARVPIFANQSVGLLCPTEKQKQIFKELILNGDIAYFAFPFNSEIEFGEKSLLESGLQIAKDLDLQFFKKQKTISFSQRDVPGLTRAFIPILKENGIKFLTVGVNSASANPVVPRIFKWYDKESENYIVSCWVSGYGTTIPSNAVVIPNFKQALIPAWRGDNRGPVLNKTELSNTFKEVKSIFPNAKLEASTFDIFFNELESSGLIDTLPIVYEEIGDTWIYGATSDPLKVAEFRAFERARNQCLENDLCQQDDPNFKLFDLMLLKNTEHTWGMDIKTFLDDFQNWSNIDFEKARNGPNYKKVELSWDEQRAYLKSALEHANPNLQKMIKEEIEKIIPRIPSTLGMIEIPISETMKFSSDFFEIGFSNQGDINSLKNFKSNIQWASETNRLCSTLYKTYNTKDYDLFFSTYIHTHESWALKDFGKPNLTLASPVSKFWKTNLKNLYRNAENSSFLLKVEVEDKTAHINYGAPSYYWISLDFKKTENDFIELFINYQWFEKTPTRLPESLFLSFNPNLNNQNSNPLSWYLYKLNSSFVDPNYVVKNGSHELHGVYATYILENENEEQKDKEKKKFFSVENLDSSVVNPGLPTAFPIPLENIKANNPNTYGMNFILYDNLWGTNYIMYYPWQKNDENSKFRFKVLFK